MTESESNVLTRNLIAARALIDTPEKWSKDAGHVVKRRWFGLVEQHSYCIIGAVITAIKTNSDNYAAENALREDTPWLIRFNSAPETTHADVMALFDRVIAKAST